MKFKLVLAAALWTAGLWGAPITVTIAGPYSNLASAEAARTAWLGGAPGMILEDFEGFRAAFPGGYTMLPAGIGTFYADPAGQGSAPGNKGTGANEFVILNSALTPFEGRFNTTPGGSNWLDSNDITNLSLTVGVPASKVYFFMTDAEDVGAGAQLKISAASASGAILQQTVSLGDLNNGAVHFVGIHAEGLIQEIRWLNGQRNDGYGLDQFGAVVIPEPGTSALIGAGLAGLGLLLRRRRG